MSAEQEKREETAEVTETNTENVQEKQQQVVSETSSEEVTAEKTHVPMTLKRFLALLSLVWLITTSATPIIFIASTLSTS
jgi:E3 ubiquitin-protein ligase DOA10